MRSHLTIIFFALLSGLFQYSCKQNEITPKEMSLENISWLLGEWQINENKHFERWQLVQNSYLAAVNYRIVDGEVVAGETIKLKKEGEQWQYVPTIMEGENSVSTVFVKTNMATDTLVFENRGHDFPKKIVYINLGNERMLAYIEGDGKRIDFPMKRLATYQ